MTALTNGGSRMPATRSTMQRHLPRQLKSTAMPTFLIYALCAFASGFALRIIDPIVLPVAHFFDVSAASAAMLNTAYALPYAIAQPFLGPMGDRFGKARCIRVCIAALALTLAGGSVAPSFEWLLISRVFAGIVAGGLIPIVLASLGDDYAMSERQVMIGRMLFAIIAGQMLGSVISGYANVAYGWRSPLMAAALLGAVAAAIAWLTLKPERIAIVTDANGQALQAPTFRSLYGRVFLNPKAPWLYTSVLIEGALFFGLFPYIGGLLLERAGGDLPTISTETGLVLGAFAIGGLAYALAVRHFIRWFGVRRMCLVGSGTAACAFGLMAFLPVWWLDALAMLVCGLAYYMLHNSLQTEATELAPSARGSAVALFACGFFAGQGIGPLLMAPLVHHAGYTVALLVSAIGLLMLGQVVVRQVIDRHVPIVV